MEGAIGGTAELVQFENAAPTPGTDTSSMEASSAARTRTSLVRQPSAPAAAGDSLFTLLPPEVVEMARRTVWDEQASEALEQLMLLAFDANGDLELDDFERIAAVKALRETMWPASAGDGEAFAEAVMARGPGGHSSEILLAPEDLRLHHDVDESRRLDRTAEGAESEEQLAPQLQMSDDLRTRVIAGFRLVDDGRLTAGEFARFLRRYRAGVQQADLNSDGLVDEADLRVFLDVANPISDE